MRFVRKIAGMLPLLWPWGCWLLLFTSAGQCDCTQEFSPLTKWLSCKELFLLTAVLPPRVRISISNCSSDLSSSLIVGKFFLLRTEGVRRQTRNYSTLTTGNRVKQSSRCCLTQYAVWTTQPDAGKQYILPFEQDRCGCRDVLSAQPSWIHATFLVPVTQPEAEGTPSSLTQRITWILWPKDCTCHQSWAKQRCFLLHTNLEDQRNPTSTKTDGRLVSLFLQVATNLRSECLCSEKMYLPLQCSRAW